MIIMHYWDRSRKICRLAHRCLKRWRRSYRQFLATMAGWNLLRRDGWEINKGSRTRSMIQKMSCHSMSKAMQPRRSWTKLYHEQSEKSCQRMELISSVTIILSQGMEQTEFSKLLASSSTTCTYSISSSRSRGSHKSSNNKEWLQKILL